MKYCIVCDASFQFFNHVPFSPLYRSCDLDEWTAPQLSIMTVGGNGNAKLYLKKHGVPDAQMTVRQSMKLIISL